jgi:hypothetical protein
MDDALFFLVVSASTSPCHSFKLSVDFVRILKGEEQS